jgi:lipopolysaccharide transport system permease protein
VSQAATEINMPSTVGGHTTRIEPTRGWRPIDLAELWRFRDLMRFLVSRDIKVRYKQTALGALWALIQPVVTMLVLHLFFGKLLGMADRVGDVPYPVFLYAGLLPWTLFASSITASSNSLVNNSHILTKVYFPRIMVPLASVGSPLLDYGIAFGVLLGMMAWFDVPFTAGLLLIPVLVVTTIICVMGVGLVLASMTVSYRDIRHAVPFLVQTWFFVTPVIYPAKLLPESVAWLYQLNPMVGPIEAFRAVIVGSPIDYVGWATSTGVGLVLLVAGVFWFNRSERRFADVI